MDDQRVFVRDKPMNVYAASQVKDVLEEARRLDLAARSCTIVAAAVRKLDSFNQGRMDS